jgi:hypothetical protein
MKPDTKRITGTGFRQAGSSFYPAQFKATKELGFCWHMAFAESSVYAAKIAVQKDALCAGYRLLSKYRTGFFSAAPSPTIKSVLLAGF